jgi:hypothetical protein
MKSFNLREDVSAEAGKGERPTPISGVYAPNYHGVNQVLHKVGGDGAIAFFDALNVESRQKLKEIKDVYDGIQTGSHLTAFNSEMQKAAEEIKKNNLSGEGYTDSITAAHDQLTKKYLDMAGNDEVRNKLQQMFLLSKSQWANSAFRDQIVITKAHAVNENEVQTETLKNQLIKNPDLFVSLSHQYESVLGTLRPVLHTAEFEKYETEKTKEWKYSYGVGLINRNPTQAQQLLQGEIFTRGVDSDKYQQLIHHARQEKEHRESLTRKLRKEVEKAKNRIGATEYTGIELAIAKGDSNVVDRIQSSGSLTEAQKNKLETKLIKHQQQLEKKNEIHFAIDKHIAEGTPASEIGAKDKIKHFEDWARATNEEKRGKGEDPLTYTEQILYLGNNSLAYDVPVPSLKISLAQTIKGANANSDGKQLLDACMAVSIGGNSPGLSGIEDGVKDFARYVVETYRSGGSVEKAKNYASLYFAPADKAVMEMRGKEWKESKYFKKGDAALEKFLEDNGFARGRFFKSVPEIEKKYLNEEAHRTIKRIFDRTGSMTEAESMAAAMLHDRFAPTEINGVEQHMADPPEKFFSNKFVAFNLVGLRGQQLIENIEKAGDNYLGNTKVRRLKNQKFVVGDVGKIFEKPLTSSNERPVEAFINEKWQRRNLNLRPLGAKPGQYVFYILLDEEDSGSGVDLLNPRNNRPAIINLSPEATGKLRTKP